MKVLKAFVFIGFLFFQIIVTYAQDDLPKIIPPSPSAQMFHRYGDYPVSHYTGIPQIKIPVYEINCGSLSIPITINYHSSGFRVQDRDGTLGLGWSLNAGGMISRQIRGIADDYSPSGYLITQTRYNPTDLNTVSDLTAYNYLREIDENIRDSEYDLFSYSAGNVQGSFALKGSLNTNGYKATVVFIDDTKDDKLTCNLNITTNKIECFDLLDANGVLYRFGKSLVNQVPAEERTGNYTSPGTKNFITSWLLTEIISADKADTIQFVYNDATLISYVPPSYVTTLMTNQVYSDCKYYQTRPPYSVSTASSSPWSYYYTRTLSEVRFRNGAVKFSYTPDNTLLSAINVFNADNINIKKVDLYTSAYGSGSSYNYHYKLDAMKVNDEEEYKFNYNYSPLQNAELSEDWWGYYNGSYYPGCMIPYILFENNYNVGQGNVTREPSEDMKNLMLNKITYPTGGSTTFDYELNKYKSNGVVKNAGGLRIYRIKNDDGNGNVSIKIYKYGKDEDGAGIVICEPIPANLISRKVNRYYGTENPPACMIEGQTGWFADWNTSIATTFANYVPKMTNFSAPVYYTEISEYEESLSNPSFNNGKTLYRYNEPVISIRSEAVAGHDYYNFNAVQMAQPIIPTQEQDIYPANRFGLLAEKEVYKKDNTAYVLLKKEINDYQYVTGEELPNLSVYRYAKLGGEQNSPADFERAFITSPNYTYMHVLNDFQYGYAEAPLVYVANYVRSGRVLLSKTTTKQYSGNEFMETGVNYFYTHSNQPQYVTTFKSNGSQDIRLYNRPRDMQSEWTSGDKKTINDAMVSKNIVSPVIQEHNIVYKIDDIGDHVMTKHTVKEKLYKIWDVQQNRINPSEVSESVYQLGGPEDVIVKTSQINFYNYDNYSNILEYAKEGNVRKSYVWGYRNSYPVAEVTNANLKDVFYTSFEEDGNSINGDAKTGVLSKTGGYNKLLSGLTTDTYILSWWQKLGSSWVIQSTTVPVNNGSYAINLTGQVDEVRFYPARAQMETFTYMPLIGMTSRTDIANNTVYYEYDSAGRLKVIKDDKKNILKAFDYKFQQTP